MLPRDPTLDCWWTTAADDLEGHAPGATFRPLEEAPADGGRITEPLPDLGLGAPAGLPSDLALVTVLGEGGMGVVHLATQSSLEREVAVKRTRSGDPRAHLALMREARIMGRLEHPNVIPVHALGRDEEGRPALVMKRVQGVSWRTLLEEPGHPVWGRRLPLSGEPLVRHIHVLLDVCNALGFAHARGVVHQDLKPDNVMVGEFGEVYVLDWGIAAPIGEIMPAGRGLLGTPAYMPPELLDRPVAAAPTVDVYLLGACLHEVLTGAPRHVGSSLREVLDHAATSPPFAYPPQTPPGLAELCNRACDPDPAARPPTVDAFREALTDWLRWAGAEQLVQTARARLDRFQQVVGSAEPDPVEVHAILDACRAVLSDVLRERPQDADAHEMMCRALEMGASFDLAHGDLAAASAMIEELRERGRDVSPLEQDLARYRRHAENLRRLSRELDYSVSARPRLALISAVLLLLVLFVGISATRHALGYTEPIILGYPLALTLLLAAGAPLAWPWFRRNRVNRQAAGALAVMTMGWLTERSLLVLVGADLRTVLTADLVVGASWMLLLGIFVRPWLAAPAPIMIVGAVLTTQLPSPQFAFLPAIVGGVLALGIGWARSHRERPSGPAADTSATTR